MTSTVDIVLTVFFAIFVVLDIFLNGVLALAIRRKRSLQTPMNLLIFHLAVTDVLIGIFIIPRHLLSYAITYPKSKASDYICQFLTGGNFIWTSVTTSSGFLTIIALERLFAVVFPHKAKLRVTKRRLIWYVWACWVSSIAFNLPSLLVLKYDHINHFCMEDWPTWTDPKAYVGMAFIAGNSSVIAMYILYSIIMFSLWKKHKAVSEVSRAARINARKRVTKMLILMTVVHTICRTPNYTFYMLSQFNPDAQYGSTVYSFTVFLILFNSATHPFFFCWYMNNLRHGVFAVLPSCFTVKIPARLRRFTMQTTDVNTDSAAGKSGQRMKDLHSSDFVSNSYDERKKNSTKLKGCIADEKEKYLQTLTTDSEGSKKGEICNKDLIISNEDFSEGNIEKEEQANDKAISVTCDDDHDDDDSSEAKEVADEVEENKHAKELELQNDVKLQGTNRETTAEENVILTMEPIEV